MANQDAFLELLLLYELLHIFCHSTVVVLRGMKRIAMITKILRNLVSTNKNHDLSLFSWWQLREYAKRTNVKIWHFKSFARALQ